MVFKFEKLEVWQLALEYIDLIYELASHLPKSEEYNLKSPEAYAVREESAPYQVSETQEDV
ncbi:MAG: four helix bundle protein [Anaerolineae bacterium]|nr:four helix bundle protein [Anaerolineae bacterium]